MANTFLILAVCIYLNKNGSTGPHLDKKKVQQLPDHFGPARASVVLQQAVQACIDCAYHQKTVFSFLKQGHGGEVISGENGPAALCLQRGCSRILSLEDVCPEARCSHRPGADRRVLSSLSCHTSVSVKQQLAAGSERSSSHGLWAQLLEQAVLAPAWAAILPHRPAQPCPSPGKSHSWGDSTTPHGKTRNSLGFNSPLSRV